jgi:hypothetical protein
MKKYQQKVKLHTIESFETGLTELFTAKTIFSSFPCDEIMNYFVHIQIIDHIKYLLEVTASLHYCCSNMISVRKFEFLTV